MTAILPTEPHAETTPMTPEEALEWIKQVDGVIYHNRHDDDVENAWVAVVRTPPAGAQAGRIILAFGETLESAAGAAEAQWDRIWSAISRVH